MPRITELPCGKAGTRQYCTEDHAVVDSRSGVRHTGFKSTIYWLCDLKKVT